MPITPTNPMSYTNTQLSPTNNNNKLSYTNTQLSPPNNNKLSSFKQSMRKSILSKISGYSSILNSISPDQTLQILRISLKKQLDRKQKLQKLMDKYQQITTQQKIHIKSIKSNIIQLKDIQTNSKTKFYLNPIIYVDNSLSKQTREYLCMLLNTFYAKYQQNSECQYRTKLLGKEMNHLLQNISANQQNLLKIQKQTIGVQVHLQGEMLSLKSKLKDQNQKQKQFQQQNKRISIICSQYENDFNLQHQKVQKLRQQSKSLQNKITQLKQKLTQGQLLKLGKQQMMANQIAYQQKFNHQLHNVDQDINKEKQKSIMLQNKIKQKKFNVEQLKTKLNKVQLLVDSLQNTQQQTQNNFSHLKCQQQQCDDKKLSQESKNNNNKSHMSLGKIKKYSELIDQINTTLQMSKSTLKFSYDVMPKDTVNYQVGMRMIDIKKQSNLNNTQSNKITLR